MSAAQKPGPVLRMIAGADLYAALEAEIAAEVPLTSNGYRKSKALCAVQSRQANRGVVGARLVLSIHGWSLRYDSGLQDFALIASSRMGQVDGTLADAERYAVEWVARSPSTRYAYGYPDDAARAALAKAGSAS